MPIVDAFGVWENLGNVSPNFDWQFFPLLPSTPNTSLRIIYFSQASGGFNLNAPRGVLRASYFSGSSYFFDQHWLTLYPKEDPEVVAYPYPPDMQTDPLPQRQFQLKLVDTRYNRRLFVDRKWSAQLFEKISTNVIYPVSPVTAGNMGGGTTGTNGTLPPGGF